MSATIDTAGIDIAVIAGDGIGPEVTAEAVKVLAKVTADEGIELKLTDYKLGAEHWLATGETLPETTIDALRSHDAILFGAVGAAPGDTSIPSGLIEREMLLKLRFSLDHYVNLRPSFLYDGVPSPLANPGTIDFIVVRDGFRRANERPRKKLTYVHKHNVLVYAGHLWKRTVEAVAEEFPEVSVDYLHVDAAMIFLVTDPARFDVIVTDNLFGDIVTDLAAAVTGGIGLAASGNINMDRTAPSMFEPVHGSAPDIAGQQLADPTAAILSAALLLEHLGHTGAAARIQTAVAADVASRDASSPRPTSAIGDAIAGAL